MIKKINILLIIIVLISFLKLIFTIITYENVDYLETKEITGIITNINRKNNKIVFDLKADKKYRITTYSDFKYKLGDKVLINAQIYIPNENTIFNLFNYRKFLLSKNIEFEGKLNSAKLIRKNSNIFYKLKNNLINYVETYKSKHYLKSFVMGDNSEISLEVKDSYQDIGISHLFAISGMHISLILLVIDKLFRKTKYKNIITIIFLIIFLFITYYPISLIRCFLFYVLNYLNKILKLEYKNYFIVICIFFIMLLFNSYLIYNVGFLFSIIITFFILLVSDKIKDYSNLKKSILISVISFLVSVPIMALSFFKINIISIIYNIIFIPIVTYIMFPLSFLTLIFPFLDEFYFMLINLFEKIVLFTNSVDFFEIVISKPNVIFLILYYVSLYLCIKVNKKLILIYFLILFLNINSNFFIRNKEVIFFDVSQGDSEVIIFPKGKTLVIDTGGSKNYSMSEKIIIPYLYSRGLKKIDLLILSHGDYDHMGEAINLVENFNVEKVIFNCGKFNELEQDLIKVLDKKKIPYYSCIKELNIDNQKLYFLNNKDYGNENNNSSVIYTEFNNHKFLFMGDAGVEVEQDLIEKYNLQNIDVLKVGHHGSRTSSSKEFIDEINPRHSVISVAKNNRYGHPNKEVLNTLNKSKIYRTDQDGSILFKIKKNKLNVETCSP